VRLFWEKRVIARLNHYDGSAAMPIYHYLIIVAFGIGIVVVGALPLVIAWIVTLIPKRLQRKRRFVVVSGALSYGFTCFVGLILLPFILIGWQVAAQLDVDGHSDLAVTLDFIAKHSMFALLGAAFVFAVIVPIYLRRRWSATFANPIASSEGA
jgi:MFS family permease